MIFSIPGKQVQKTCVFHQNGMVEICCFVQFYCTVLDIGFGYWYTNCKIRSVDRRFENKSFQEEKNEKVIGTAPGFGNGSEHG